MSPFISCTTRSDPRGFPVNILIPVQLSTIKLDGMECGDIMEGFGEGASAPTSKYQEG